MNSFNKKEFDNGTVLSRIGLKTFITNTLLFVMVILTIVMLLSNNMQVKAYDSTKPSDIDYR